MIVEKDHDLHDLHAWVESPLSSKIDEDYARYFINAFSDFVTAVDREYLYNTTFLKRFVDGFLESNVMLKKKKKILALLISKLEAYKDRIVINVDDVWIFYGPKGGISLSHSFNMERVTSTETQFQIKVLDEPIFSIAGKLDIVKAEEQMKEAIDLFEKKILNNNENGKL